MEVWWEQSSLVLWSWARPAGTKVRGSIPEGKQKAYTHSCFATSAKCTGNHDFFLLRCSVPMMRFFRMCCRRGVLQSASKSECYNECSLYVFFIFYNNTICAMMCLCVSLSWVQPTGTLESCFEVQCSSEELLLQNCRRGVMQTRSTERFKKQMAQQISNFVSQSRFL